MVVLHVVYFIWTHLKRIAGDQRGREREKAKQTLRFDRTKRGLAIWLARLVLLVQLTARFRLVTFWPVSRKVEERAESLL